MCRVSCVVSCVMYVCLGGGYLPTSLSPYLPTSFHLPCLFPSPLPPSFSPRPPHPPSHHALPTPVHTPLTPLPNRPRALQHVLRPQGPKSAEVVRLARELGCHAILGNHELMALRAASIRQGGKQGGTLQGFGWTDEMGEADLTYLRTLPYTLGLPLHNAVVVHAGLVPGVPVEDQCRWNMVTMRNLFLADDEGGDASGGGSGGGKGGGVRLVGTERDQPNASPWASLWEGPEHVYFGHDAKRELQLYPFATGLDTGCMYGRKLTAVILELGKAPHLMSVEARDLYVAPGYF